MLQVPLFLFEGLLNANTLKIEKQKENIKDDNYCLLDFLKQKTIQILFKNS